MISEIKIVDLIKSYGDAAALDKLNMSATYQQITSIVGINGAGKTTLFKIIAGLDKPNSGRIFIDGKVVDPDELRKHCTMVFQKTVMLGGTVYDNVAYGLRLNRIDSKEIPSKVKSALAVVNLDGFEKRKARKLSSGEQQRVAIARAIALDREVLLIDEPTANLDPANAIIIEQGIKESAQGRVVLLCTHNLPQARRLSHRIIHLYHGRVIEEGETSTFFAHPADEKTKLFIAGELQF